MKKSIHFLALLSIVSIYSACAQADSDQPPQIQESMQSPPTGTTAPLTHTPLPPPTPSQLPPLSGSGGGRIAFASNREGNYEIYVMNADGSDQRRLTKTIQNEDGSPDWSPDGGKIAYSSSREGPGEIRIMNSDGSSQKRLTTDIGAAPSWSPDGKSIVYHREFRGSDIYVIDSDGSNEQQLTHSDVPGTVTLISSPKWSPDGKNILCVVEHNPDRQFFGKKTLQIFNVQKTLQKGESTLVELLPRVGDNFDDWPDWSPDGSQIAFSADIDGRRKILIVNADGSDFRILTHSNEADEVAPAWSPDGSKIAFQSNPDGNWDIFVMNADGTNRKQITNDLGSDVDPDWHE